MKDNLTQDGKHRIHRKDPIDNTVYYKNLETGQIEYIGKNGEWVKA